MNSYWMCGLGNTRISLAHLCIINNSLMSLAILSTSKSSTNKIYKYKYMYKYKLSKSVHCICIYWCLFPLLWYELLIKYSYMIMKRMDYGCVRVNLCAAVSLCYLEFELVGVLSMWNYETLKVLFLAVSGSFLYIYIWSYMSSYVGFSQRVNWEKSSGNRSTSPQTSCLFLWTTLVITIQLSKCLSVLPMIWRSWIWTPMESNLGVRSTSVKVVLVQKISIPSASVHLRAHACSSQISNLHYHICFFIWPLYWLWLRISSPTPPLTRPHPHSHIYVHTSLSLFLTHSLSLLLAWFSSFTPRPQTYWGCSNSIMPRYCHLIWCRFDHLSPWYWTFSICGKLFVSLQMRYEQSKFIQIWCEPQY